MFIRFVRQTTVDGLATREGFLQAAYEMRRNPDIDRYTREQLETLLAWFGQHLKLPAKFDKSTSKGRTGAKRRG